MKLKLHFQRACHAGAFHKPNHLLSLLCHVKLLVLASSIIFVVPFNHLELALALEAHINMKP